MVDKPHGPTSHDVVNKMRRLFGTRRIGHAGTLDPMATGVLVLLLGEATKLSSVLTRDSKEYETVVQFGSTTDTLDAEGKITKRVHLEPGWLDRARLSRALELELHREQQLPPIVSAIKVNGQRSYDRARAGETPELHPREVEVLGIELLDVAETSIRVRLAVSKGYYVRAFARDLGDSLGVPAHLTELRRLKSGAFHLDESQAWPPDPSNPLLSLDRAVRRSMPWLSLHAPGALRASQGKPIRPEDWEGEIQWPDSRSALQFESDPERLVAAFHGDDLVALLEPVEFPQLFRVKRGFVSTSTADDTPESSETLASPGEP